MTGRTIHHVYRPKGAVPASPSAGEPPPPLPDAVTEAISAAPSLPLFFYRLPLLRENVSGMAASFPGFFFPAKCNPHPEVLRAVLDGGAGLSLRSFGELELALRLGAPKARLSFTGWGLGPALMGRLIGLGVTVNLDSAREVRDWVAHFPGEPFGVRLMAGDDPEYLSAGFAREEVGQMLEDVNRAKARLTGVMVHWPHAVATAGEMAREFAPLPRLLANTIGPALAELDYLNLGGGWPAPYAGGEPIAPASVAEALSAHLLPALRASGFAGTLAVEPGRAVAAPCGYWAARVLKVDGTTATLDTPPPTPPYCLPYPAHLLRNGKEVRNERGKACRLLGLASPPLDVIREQVPLPPLRAGDILVFSQAGAYLESNLLLEAGVSLPGSSVID